MLLRIIFVLQILFLIIINKLPWFSILWSHHHRVVFNKLILKTVTKIVCLISTVYLKLLALCQTSLRLINCSLQKKLWKTIALSIAFCITMIVWKMVSLTITIWYSQWRSHFPNVQDEIITTLTSSAAWLVSG